MFDEKEKLVKEQRLIEATKKKLFGMEGKIALILKYLGKPVVEENVGFYSERALPDFYAQEDDDKLPTFGEDLNIQEIGKFFDGLRYGFHLEIRFFDQGRVPVKVNENYITYEVRENVPTLSYKGYDVYREVEGDLDMYLPSENWEDIIDGIFEKYVKPKRKNFKEEQKEVKKQELKEEKVGFLTRLRERWGI